MDLSANTGIYVIINTINQKTYVGQSSNLHQRWGKHQRELRKQIHQNDHLQNAWNKYGASVFVFELLESVEIPDGLSITDRRKFLAPFEQRWMDELKPEYNKAPAAGSNLGLRRSPETKALMSEQRMGNTFSLGRKDSSETIEKKRRVWLGRKHTPESIAKMIGHPVTAETRAKISASRKAAWERKRNETDLT